MSVLDAGAALSRRFKRSDPKPAYCSACFQGAQAGVEFFDLDAAFDAGSFVHPDNLTYVSGSDDLHLCEDCVRDLVETAGFNPELHGRQARRIRGLENEVDHWKATTRRLRKELDEQMSANLGPAPRGRPPKA